MSYNKQNFISGQVLEAQHLNHIENGIGELDAQISQLSSEKVDISDIVQEAGQSETLVMSQKAVTNLVAGAQSGGSGLPSVDASDNGKTVKVVDGAWSVEQLSYNDLLDKPNLFSGNYNDLTNLPVYDTTPTSGSTNPVTSGGLFTKFTEQEEQINTALAGAHGAMSGALTWDGVIGNKEIVVVDSSAEGTTSIVHVSDEYPEILSLFLSPSESNTLPCTIAMSGLFSGNVGDRPMLQYPIGMLPGGLIMCEGGVFIVPSDNYTPPEDIGIPVTFPKKGVYFICMTLNEMAALGLSAPAMYISALSLSPFHSFADNSGGDASKYFEEKKIVTNSGDTLTWDGNTEGLVGNVVATDNTTTQSSHYKVFDGTLTKNDVANGLSYTLNGGYKKEYTGEEIQAKFNDDGSLISFFLDDIIYIPYDNYIYTYSSVSMKFPEAGIYFVNVTMSIDGNPVISYVTSLTINGHNFIETEIQEVIKTEHLPEALRFGEITSTTYGDTLTWDGNTEGLVNIDGAFYKVSDTIPTLNDIHQGFSLTFSAIDGSDSNTISVSAEEAASIQMNDGIILFEVFAIATQPITETKNDGTTITYPAGVYFKYFEDDNIYVSSLTINDYKGFTTTSTELVKIDKRYLPDDIGGGGSGLPEVTADDEGKTVKVVDGEWAVEKFSYNDLSDKPTLFSGSYNDLSDKPTLGALASKNSLSASDVGAATIVDVNSAIEAAIGAAIAASY